MRMVMFAAAAALVAWVQPATAQTVYTSRSTFLAATSGTTTIDFNGQAAGTQANVGTSYTTGGATFTVTGQDTMYTIGSGGGYSGGDKYGSGYLEWQGSANVLTVTLGSPVTAVGFDYIELVSQPETFTLSANGTAIGTSSAAVQFLGLTSNSAFSSFTITGSAPGTRFPTIDNLTFGTAGAAPEPASWALMILGFGLTGVALRRRQARPGDRACRTA